MGQLGDWAQEQSSFLILSDGESIKAIYKDFKIVPDQFNPEKEKVQYRLTLDDKDRFLQSSAASLARTFDRIPTGSEIVLTRHGIDRDTRYTVKLATMENKQADIDSIVDSIADNFPA